MAEAWIGHNGVAGDRIKAFIERIERLQEEIDGINGDKRDVFAEAKGEGFDVKIIKRILQLRRKDHGQRQEEDALLELYMQAIGMA